MRAFLKRTAGLAVVFALVASLCPALRALPAARADQPGLTDGTYALEDLSVSTGMVDLDLEDAPGKLVVSGQHAWLVVSVYDPGKYDAVWPGKRSEAPSDPATAQGLVTGSFVEMDESYRESGAHKSRSWTDEEGVVGAAGTEYKAVRFVFSLSTAEVARALEDDSEADLHVVFRRARWSPSNAGKWMGTNDNYFTFGAPTWESASTDVPQAGTWSYPQESALDAAKALIAALPADPDDIDASWADEIGAARAAYDALSTADQSTLDSTVLDKEQSYGRWLESAVWGLAAATETVDASTDLSSGDYSAYVSSESDMGKSTSERARSWSVTKLVVADGRFSAVIACDGASAFKKLRLGGIDYTAELVDGVPTFTVPFQVNESLKFTVDASALADSIAYEIEASLDLSAATSDEVANARAIAALARSGVRDSWTQASQARVRAAAGSLAELAASDGVKRVELLRAQAELAAAQAAAETPSAAKSGDEEAAVQTKKGAASRSRSGVSGDGSGGSTSAAASSAGSGGSSSGDSSSRVSAARVASSGASGSAVAEKGAKADGAPGESSAAEQGADDGTLVYGLGGAAREPNYALLLFLGFLLLLVLGMVLRSVSFNRMMRRGGQRGKAGR